MLRKNNRGSRQSAASVSFPCGPVLIVSLLLLDDLVEPFTRGASNLLLPLLTLAAAVRPEKAEGGSEKQGGHKNNCDQSDIGHCPSPKIDCSLVRLRNRQPAPTDPVLKQDLINCAQVGKFSFEERFSLVAVRLA
jgi:hypothetical protein